MTHCQLMLCGSLSSNTMCRTNSRPRAGPGGPGVWRPRASSPAPPRHSSCTAARLMSEIRLLPLAHSPALSWRQGGRRLAGPAARPHPPSRELSRSVKHLTAARYTLYTLSSIMVARISAQHCQVFFERLVCSLYRILTTSLASRRSPVSLLSHSHDSRQASRARS